MERIKALNLYQKRFLLLLMAMVLVFTVIYPITIARVGYAYHDALLIRSQENDSVVYSGKIRGEQARFTVSQDHTVEFQYGENSYGPYTAREVPDAIPKDHPMRYLMTGVELRQGETVIFRGGVLSPEESYQQLYNEDGSLASPAIDITCNVIIMGESENVMDSMEPSASTILDLMAGPALTHKGEWVAWFGGILICTITAISILFADELFRWHLSFQIRDSDNAEPSDWEITSRYISWSVLSLFAMILFIAGLQ